MKTPTETAVLAWTENQKLPPKERAKLMAKAIGDWCVANDSWGTVEIAVEAMTDILKDAGLMHHNVSYLAARKQLDGLSTMYGGPDQPLERLSLVKKMTGTWIWKWNAGHRPNV